MKRPSLAPPPPRSVISSSPGRPEKLATAPGLARLLRGKSGSGSRSGGRTPFAPRSSPMFVSRSRSVGPNTAAAGEGDPSSPKVSCIGQVRIRNKKKTAAKLARKTSYHQHQQQQQHHQLPAMRCRCLSRAMLCRIWPCRGQTDKGQRRWNVGRWWFKKKKKSSNYREAGGEEEKSVPFPPAPRASVSDFSVSEETEEEEEEEETRVFMPSATATPPKNALLLMRCRSAPHNRSSALSNTRFTVLETESTEPTEPPVRVEEVRISCTEKAPSPVLCTDETEEAAAPKFMLTRCKSEPARTAAAKLAVAEENVVAYRNSDSRRTPTAPPPSPPAMNGV